MASKTWLNTYVIASAKEKDALNITLSNCINSTNEHLCNYCTKIFVIVVKTCVCRRSVENKAAILSYPTRGNKGNRGCEGNKGNRGEGATRGTSGNMGNRGTGERGEQGEEGNWGGIRGDRWDKGNKGEQGQEGNMGIYWPLRKRVARLPNSTKKRKTSVDRLLQTTQGDKHFKSFINVRESRSTSVGSSKLRNLPSNQRIGLHSCQSCDFISQSVKENWQALRQLLDKLISKAAQNLTPAT